MPDLERIIHPPVHPLGALRKRLVLATGFLIGATTVAMLVHARPRTVVPIPAPPPPAITIAPPIVVTIEHTVAAPAPPPPPAPELGCPTVGATDDPIGTAIDPADYAQSIQDGDVATAIAAARAPQIAVHHAGLVWVSDDEGRTFRRAFEQHSVEHLAIDPAGVIYAQSDQRLAVRAPGGKTTWRTLPQLACDDDGRCDRTIGARGTELVVIANARISTSTDRGKSFTTVRDPAFAWTGHGAPMFSWRGSLYQVAHYTDMCGVDDYPTYRLTGAHDVTHETFHAHFVENEPVLTASSDVGSTWTWREQCRAEPAGKPRRCANNATRSAMLIAAWLRPAEGARTLAVHDGSAVELCSGGARQVYRKFPYERIDAVDVAGRALVMRDLTLLRWSPLHGWRKLHTFVED